jgi:DNA adenine methylase
MRYFGGKTRICKELAYIINSLRKKDQLFISPFVGGGWVEHLISGPKECYDKHFYLISMYKALQFGWRPPKELSRTEYEYIKGHKDENPALTGFVGFGCSFAGKWFGGYAKDDTGRNYCLNAYNSLMKKFKGLEDAKFECNSYSDLNPHDSIIYCDPPYNGTTQYDKSEVGDFNHDMFWEVVRGWGDKSHNNIVLISEYTAPEGIRCIWEKSVKLDIRDKTNNKKARVEKLFAINLSEDISYDEVDKKCAKLWGWIT